MVPLNKYGMEKSTECYGTISCKGGGGGSYSPIGIKYIGS